MTAECWNVDEPTVIEWSELPSVVRLTWDPNQTALVLSASSCSQRDLHQRSMSGAQLDERERSESMLTAVTLLRVVSVLM